MIKLTSLAHGGGCGCKIAPGLLQDLLATNLPNAAPDALLVGTETRDDAAVYKLSDDDAIVATTDFFTPIVDDPFDFGRIAATNALSDLYAMGATPLFCLAILGAPIDKLPPEMIARILDGGRTVANEAGAPVAGGHSIDTAEPIYGLAAIGRASPTGFLTNAGARVGDVLILGKPLGVGIFSAAFKRGILSDTDYQAMLASTTLLNRPGMDLPSIHGVHAATDVTGFGLLGHLGEMVTAAELSAEIRLADVPVFERARALLRDGVKTGASGRNWSSVEGLVTDDLDQPTRDLLCDPQTSGGLLVACAPTAVDAVLGCFTRHRHDNAAIIGRVADGPARISIR